MYWCTKYGLQYYINSCALCCSWGGHENAKMFFAELNCHVLYNWDWFHLSIVNYTFYPSKDKMKYRYDHLFEHRRSLRNHTLIHCRQKSWQIWGVTILTRHNLIVTRNITLEEVSCKVNEYSVSENTLYRCVDGFNWDQISIFSHKHFGRPFSAVIKWGIF